MDMQQWLDVMSGWGSDLVRQLPLFAGAAAWTAAGWVIARLVRSLSSRFIDSGLNRLAGRPSVRAALESTGARDSIPRLTGLFLFWAVWILFAAAAAETLGLPVVTGSLNRFAYYIPNVLAAIVVGFAGLVAGNLVGSVIATGAEKAGVGRAAMLGSMAQVSVVMVALIVALEQLGINGGVLVIMFAVVIGVLLGTGGLAFGLGARVAMGNVIARHYVALSYRPGQTVRIDEVEGTVVEITPTAVLIDTSAGRVSMPAQRFLEVMSVLLPGGAGMDALDGAT